MIQSPRRLENIKKRKSVGLKIGKTSCCVMAAMEKLALFEDSVGPEPRPEPPSIPEDLLEELEDEDLEMERKRKIEVMDT